MTGMDVIGPVSDWPLRGIKEPHENDYLYGKDGGADHHPGNKRYRSMVEDRRIDYANSERLSKPLIALELIREWREQDPPGRFLKMDKDGLWKDVGDKKAREKTSQVLREKLKQLDNERAFSDSVIPVNGINPIISNVSNVGVLQITEEKAPPALHQHPVEETPVFMETKAVRKKVPKILQPKDFHTILKPQQHSLMRFISSEEQPLEPEEKKEDNNTAAADEWVPCLDNLKEKLYNQKKEKDKILDAYHRCVVRNHLRDCNCSLCRSCRNNNFDSSRSRKSTVDFILISGPTGAGKTRLALSLKEHLQQSHGNNNKNKDFFLQCKYDQFSLQRRDPFVAFEMAFTEFTNQVWERGREAVLSMRDAIRRSGIGREDEKVLTRMIPALVKILGDDAEEVEAGDEEVAPSSNKIGADNAHKRFLTVFRMFVKAISSPEQPVILLVDDLHWADPCSLYLLKSLITDSQNIDGLVIVGTCDNSYVTPQSQLSHILREMEDKHQVSIQSIRLSNHSQETIRTLISEWLHSESAAICSKLNCKILADLVYHQTNGNNFYVVQCVRWMVEERLLRYNRSQQTWEWDEQEIRLSIDNVCGLGDFLVDKLQQLPMNVQDLLKVSACLVSGAKIDLSLLHLVLDFPAEDALNEAVAKGILYDCCGSYTFSHAGFQWASYSLVPNDEKESFHLWIGRRIWNGIDINDMDKHIFLLLSQLSLGRKHIIDQREKYAIAILCLHAGKRAASSSAFGSASVHFDFALSLMDKRSCWRDQYELTLNLHDAAAEMELVKGDIDKANSLLEEIFANVRNFPDKIQAYSSKIYALSLRDQQEEAIATGLDVLKQLGEKCPKKFCKSCLHGEIRSIRRMLSRKSDEHILRLPVMEGPRELAVMQVLNLMICSSFHMQPELGLFLQLRWLKLTLKHGLSIYASFAFAIYGSMCLHVGHLDDGLRFGGLALKLLDRFQSKSFLPRVHIIVYGMLNYWKGPLRDNLDPLLEGYRIGLETGDNEFAFINASMYYEAKFFGGAPLHMIEPEVGKLLSQIKAKNIESPKVWTQPLLWTLRFYRNLPLDPSPSSSSSRNVNEKSIPDVFTALDQKIEEANGRNKLGPQYWKMALGYDFGHYEVAAEMADLLRKTEGKGHFFECAGQTSGFLLAALTYLKLARQQDSKKQLRKARRIAKKFRVLAKSSPHNILNKHHLLEAEIASTSLYFMSKSKIPNKAKRRRLVEKAYNNYICSIALAGSEGFLHEQALANELLAHHLFFRLNDTSKAKQYFGAASALFLEWGAIAKVNYLRNEVDKMFGPKKPKTLKHSSAGSSSLTATSVTSAATDFSGDARVSLES